MLLFSDALLSVGAGSKGAVEEALQRHRSLQERFVSAHARLCWAHPGPFPSDF